MDGWMRRERASPESGGAERAMCGTLYVSIAKLMTDLTTYIDRGGNIRTCIFIILLHQENEKENERGDPFPIEAAHLIFSNRRLPL